MLLLTQIPTVTWLSPEYAKRQVLKFWLETYVTPFVGPQRTSLNCVDNLRQICPPIFFRTYFAYFLSKFMKIILLKNLFFKEVGYCTHISLFLRIVCFMTSIYAKKNHTFLTFHLSLFHLNLRGCHAVSLKKTKQFPCFDNVMGLKKKLATIQDCVLDVQTSQARPHSLTQSIIFSVQLVW